MQGRIGIPRALLYYDYYPLWRGFFNYLGYEVVTSPPTNEEIANLGVASTNDEVCYPVKIAHGHARYLAKQGVDYIFAPRLVSIARKTYICPKFMGLPEMLRGSLPRGITLIAPVVNLHRGKWAIVNSLREISHQLNVGFWQTLKAYQSGYQDWRKHRQLMCLGMHPEEAITVLYEPEKIDLHMAETRLRFALLGHPYDIYDPHVNMGLLPWLEERGVRTFTSDMLPESEIERQAAVLPKQLFWSLGRRVVGAARHYARSPDIDGIVLIVSFGCGLESLVAELVKTYAIAETKKPYLLLTVDEHTGAAGMLTRLEAFIDMVNWRKNHESNVSSHG